MKALIGTERAFHHRYVINSVSLWRYDKKCRLKYRRHFLFRVCLDVCRRRVYVPFR